MANRAKHLTLTKQTEKTMNVYKKALEHFGESNQVSMAKGECGEFIAAATQYFTQGRGDAESVAEEIADVEIMMSQMREVIGNDLVDKVKGKKLDRLWRMIDRPKHINCRCVQLMFPSTGEPVTGIYAGATRIPDVLTPSDIKEAVLNAENVIREAESLCVKNAIQNAVKALGEHSDDYAIVPRKVSQDEADAVYAAKTKMIEKLNTFGVGEKLIAEATVEALDLIERHDEPTGINWDYLPENIKHVQFDAIGYARVSEDGKYWHRAPQLDGMMNHSPELPVQLDRNA